MNKEPSTNHLASIATSPSTAIIIHDMRWSRDTNLRLFLVWFPLISCMGANFHEVQIFMDFMKSYYPQKVITLYVLLYSNNAMP